MSNLQIALVLVAVALALAWWFLRRRGEGKKVEAEAERIDTLIGWPPQPTRVLSTAERIAFGTLVRALPEYMILAQVPLSRFLNVPKRNSYADWLRRVGYQCVDFVVCDMAAQVVAVVELQSPGASDRARKRLARISRTLKAAQIPLQVWSEQALPNVEVARDVLLPRPAPEPERPKVSPFAGTLAAPAAAAPAVTAAARRNPFEDTDRDSEHDERIELLEPPPSTWFDDMDSDPVPLSKR
jgi:Protein of unknown function (DUF2726)